MVSVTRLNNLGYLPLPGRFILNLLLRHHDAVMCRLASEFSAPECRENGRISVKFVRDFTDNACVAINCRA